MTYRAVVAALAILFAGCGKTAAPEASAKNTEASAKDAKNADSDDDGPGVTVGKGAQLRAAIKVEDLTERTLQPEQIAYGKLEEDPAESFVVRAPVAGTLRASSAGVWPSPGQSIAAGTALGFVDPRLALADRLSLETQLATANADLKSSATALQAAQSVYDRARALNADNKNISDKALQEAGARLASEQAREAGIRATIQVLNRSLDPSSIAAAPLTAVHGGDVVELLAHPGETVEQGATLLRLARLDHLLARIDFPVGQRFEATSGPARIVPSGWEDQPGVSAERIGPAAASDPHAQGISMLYRLTGALPGLRAGAAVTAHFTLRSGAAEKGILIPRSAIVQQDGRLWAYVQTKDDRFSRRPVPLDFPTSAGFLTSKGFSPGDRLVITGAQTLLSEEFKSKNEADAN